MMQKFIKKYIQFEKYFLTFKKWKINLSTFLETLILIRISKDSDFDCLFDAVAANANAVLEV